ncbi:MAG: 50S ribosomal protein L27 [Candidatus Omnitrophota bacterium]
MAQRGGLSHIHYKETRGLKIANNQFVKKGTILTREGGKWKPGLNVGGRSSLFALCDGKVYFTKKKGLYYTKKLSSFINIKETATKKG